MEQNNIKRRRITGLVTSDKMDKTVVVKVERMKKHPKYLKQYRVHKKFKAHVEKNGEYKIGDKVIIEETNPISKEKRWRVVGLAEGKTITK